MVEVSQVIFQEADLPDPVLDLSDAHDLAGEGGRKADSASADTGTFIRTRRYRFMPKKVVEIRSPDSC